jgi:asparagine N-glycosylation enzyme membrane subunit Stt3
MAIIPAHLMRSVGGGYDNESIAVTAMLITFYFWCRSVRTESSWPFGILAGIMIFIIFIKEEIFPDEMNLLINNSLSIFYCE